MKFLSRLLSIDCVWH